MVPKVYACIVEVKNMDHVPSRRSSIGQFSARPAGKLIAQHTMPSTVCTASLHVCQPSVATIATRSDNLHCDLRIWETDEGPTMIQTYYTATVADISKG